MNGLPIPISEITLNKILSGEMNELFDEALGRVRENIQDERSYALQGRKIQIEIMIVPDISRETAGMYCKINTKLAPLQIKGVVELTSQKVLNFELAARA